MRLRSCVYNKYGRMRMAVMKAQQKSVRVFVTPIQIMYKDKNAAEMILINNLSD